MRVFLAGASGAIGRPLVRQLVERGHEVVGMTRSNAEAIETMGAHAVLADAFDGEAVRSAVEEAQPDVVVNELTDLAKPLNPRKFEEWLAGTNRLRRDGTRNLADAAAAAGVQKFISQSVAFAYKFELGTKTEDSPIRGSAAGEMGSAMEELERVTLAATGGIVLRYGYFYGPGTAYARDGQQIEMIRRRQLPVIGDGMGCFPFIHVEDAAAATVAAIESGAPGIYNVVDDEPAPVREYVPFLADLVGAKKPWRVPAWLARLVAGRVVGFATRLQPVSNAKAKQELGWQPRYSSWREGFQAELG
ncbi:MAG TPA: NAD(P)-dependent oxidoreductase [Thermoleophilaceae bacterium]|nr:NAD(P)-dependent oxidoreductase [Thermoleophilaceae bacterium]